MAPVGSLHKLRIFSGGAAPVSVLLSSGQPATSIQQSPVAAQQPPSSRPAAAELPPSSTRQSLSAAARAGARADVRQWSCSSLSGPQLRSDGDQCPAVTSSRPAAAQQPSSSCPSAAQQPPAAAQQHPAVTIGGGTDGGGGGGGLIAGRSAAVTDVDQRPR